MVSAQSARGPFALLLVALARDVLENDRRQYAVKAVTAASACEPPGGWRGLCRPYARRSAESTPRRFARAPCCHAAIPDQGLQVAVQPLLPCNFRPVSGELCALDGASMPKGVHCMCTRARLADIRRRCPGDASSRELVGSPRAPCALDGPARTDRRGGLRLRLLRRGGADRAAGPGRARRRARRRIRALLGTPPSSSGALRVRLGIRRAGAAAFIPLLLLRPLPYVPILFAAAGRPGLVPDFAGNSWQGPLAEADRGLLGLARRRSLILAALRPATWTAPTSVYALRSRLSSDRRRAGRHPQPAARRRAAPRGRRGFFGAARVERSSRRWPSWRPLAAVDEPLYLLAIAPVVWLLDNFSQDRRERYAKALELTAPTAAR